MVLINDKKFACATCIKGHRVSGCTHTDRPLFEVKKKGRPATQCQCCKDRRKSGNVHNKCVCGDAKEPEVILPPGHPGLDVDGPDEAGPSGTSGKMEEDEEDADADGDGDGDGESDGALQPVTAAKKRRETKKGRPGDQATFPNGLRDVHEMAAAADALTGMAEDPMRSAERSVARLLNPCSCRHNGICKCCEPKRPPRRHLLPPSPHAGHSRSRSTSSDFGKSNPTDNLVEMFKARAPSPSPFGSSGSSPNPSPISPSGRFSANNTLPVPDISPENPHHPAHTSKHVHKTKLFSPYSHEASTRHSKRNSISRRSISGSSVRSLRIRPLADMTKFLSAALNPDGSTANEISRSDVGLPGIRTFDEMAEKAGVKVEPMDVEDEEMEGDTPLAFPTQEDVVIGACTCGSDCDCPGCATHDNGGQSGSGGHDCGENCRSHFDCGGEVSVPSGLASIDQLLSVAAASVPRPSRYRQLNALATDTTLLPPSAAFSPDAAAGLGVVELRPLECCNGRCQCAPGSCGCKEDCCGCCVRCACAEDAPTPTQSNPSPSIPPGEKGSCCGGTGSKSGLTVSTQLSPSHITPPRLSPSSATGHPFNMSPFHSPLMGAMDPNSSSSTSGSHHRHSFSSSSHHSPLLTPSSPHSLHPPNPISNPGSTAASPCCSPATTSAPTLQVNTSFQHSPMASPAHSPGATFFQLPSPGLNSAPAIPSVTVETGSLAQSDGPLSAPAHHDLDPSQGFRRASSPHHGHSQSVSSLTNRRATITGVDPAGAVKRSASTGKQAAKAAAAAALSAANHGQPVRPIAPRPSANNASLLVPPKAKAGSSSRPISPSGRRRSSSSVSRGHSPAPSPSKSSHHHRASESAISGSAKDPATATLSVHEQMLPMVTTSAPGETRQEVSFDPSLDARDSSEEREGQNQNQMSRSGQGQGQEQGQDVQMDSNMSGMPDDNIAQAYHAYLQQIENDPAVLENLGFDMSAMTGGQVPSQTAQQPHQFGSFGRSEDQSQTQFIEMVARTLAEQTAVGGISQNGQQMQLGYGQPVPPQASQSIQHRQQHQSSQPHQPYGYTHPQPQSSNIAFNQTNPFGVITQSQQEPNFSSFSFDQSRHQPQQLAQHQQQDQLLQSQMMQYQLPQAPGQSSYPNFFNGMSGFFPPNMQQGQGWQMPLQQQQQRQQQQPQHSAPAHHPAQPFGPVTQGQQQHQPPAPPAGINPNLIDLSQPLDSSAVDRIIKALQEQQSRQGGSVASIQQPRQQMEQSSMPPPPIPPPKLGQRHGHSLSHSHAPQSQSQAQAHGMQGGFEGQSNSSGGQLSTSAPQSLGPLHLALPNHPHTLRPQHSNPSLGSGPGSANHTPSHSISSFDSFLAAPSDSSGSIHSGMPSGNTSYTLGTDEDVFEQFILENHTEGLDLSGLDLGAAAAAATAGAGGSGGKVDGQGMVGSGALGAGSGIGLGGVQQQQAWLQHQQQQQLLQRQTDRQVNPQQGGPQMPQPVVVQQDQFGEDIDLSQYTYL